MNIMYRDSEQVIHFARKSAVDGRLIPIAPQKRIFVAVEDSALIRGYWLEPVKGKVGCEGCLVDKTSACFKIQSAINREKTLQIEGGCSAMGWNMIEERYAPWESYRKIAELQAKSRWPDTTPSSYGFLETFSGLWSSLVEVFCKTRPGFVRHPQHTGVYAAHFEHDLGWPVNMAVLVAEQPTEGKDGNAQMVEYTPDLGKMGKGQRVTMKLGRYLKRHWPNASDTAIRDIVALHAPVEFKLSKRPEDFIKAVEEGPQSCMKDCEAYRSYGIHPYSAYCPELGWSIAMTTKGGKIVGRALVHNNAYVRSFKAEGDDPDNEGYSDPDERLEAWLKSQGIKHLDEWPDGTPLKKLQTEDQKMRNSKAHIVPYLDGDRACVGMDGDILRICDEGDEAQQQSGIVYVGCNYGDSNALCDVCEERRCDGDESEPVRYNGDEHAEYRCVCSDCLDNQFTWVEGSANSGDSYYVPSNQAETATDGTQVDTYYLPDDYVILYDDSIAPVNDTTWVESEDGYYMSEDVVHLHDGIDALREDCSQCEVTDEWYKDEDVYQMTAATVAKENMESWLDDMTFEDAIATLQQENNAGVIKGDEYLELVDYVHATLQPAKEKV